MEIVGGQDKNTHSTKRRLSGAPDTKLYWYDGARQVLTETDSRGNAVDNYVYFNGVSIAKLHIEPGPTYYSYYVSDHLGTTRMITDQAGNVCYDADYFPWGGEQHIYVNGCPQSYKFSGKERDPDMGSDYFGARFYKYTMARFYSPDWKTPLSKLLTNPQDLNLYSYTINNPLRYVDPDGRDWQKAWQDLKTALSTIYARASIGVGLGAKEGLIGVFFDWSLSPYLRFSFFS